MQRLSGFICVFLPSKDDRQCAGISTGFLSHGIAQERNGVFKKKGISIALVIHSLDRSLFSRLIAIRSLEGISIALAIHSLDRSLQEINPKGWCAVRTLQDYRSHYSFA